MDYLQAAQIAASEETDHIDARIRAKLLKRAHKQGITDQDEALALIEAWKRAARKTKRLHSQHGRHKKR